jgi:hypothetical protein
MAPLSNAERQARHRDRQKYEHEVLKQQIAAIERALNEVRQKADLPPIQLPKSAYDPHR